MAGHSHWANISIKKGVADKKKGKLFGKLSRAIIVAAHHGGGDPSSNLALRYAIDKARKASMPKDNIERAVKKGCGDGGLESYSEVVYEGYGPGGVAVLCDILTENRNRTAGEIRQIFDGNGGRLGSAGCVAWMFERKGVFLIPARHVDENTLYSDRDRRERRRRQALGRIVRSDLLAGSVPESERHARESEDSDRRRRNPARSLEHRRSRRRRESPHFKAPRSSRGSG